MLDLAVVGVGVWVVISQGFWSFGVWCWFDFTCVVMWIWYCADSVWLPLVFQFSGFVLWFGILLVRLVDVVFVFGFLVVMFLGWFRFAGLGVVLCILGLGECAGLFGYLCLLLF